jgi:hypothetical protein
VHQTLNLTASGAVGGSFRGMPIGFLFLNPLAGAARKQKRLTEKQRSMPCQTLAVWSTFKSLTQQELFFISD